MVTVGQIREAAERLPPYIARTPLLPFVPLSESLGFEVWLKCENLQLTGSYKARAAAHILNSLNEEERRAGVALSSSGNFAAAFAYLGRKLGIPITVVMMERTSPTKVARTRDWGAEVVLCANRHDARFEVLDQLQRERGCVKVDHFEDLRVVAGHGTIGLEIAEALAELDTILVPSSSGGLIAGVAVAVKALCPKARVVGVQPEGSNAMTLSWRAGRLVDIGEPKTICDALVAQRPGKVPFDHVMKYVDDFVLVSDKEVEQAVRLLAFHAKLVTEPGGAVGVAALMAGKVQPLRRGPAVALLSGGNIRPELLAGLVEE